MGSTPVANVVVDHRQLDLRTPAIPSREVLIVC